MPLQNRCLPDGKLVAMNWRGTFMGNRGGRLHDPHTRCLLNHRWTSKRWIICVTEFKDRQRDVMGKGYTELFFLDEVSALATGHRPCFECRRESANRFADLWRQVHGIKGSKIADKMDAELHAQRLSQKSVLNPDECGKLPDGAMVSDENHFLAIKDGQFWCWSGDGYSPSSVPDKEVKLLTPKSILKLFEAGFEPVWHPSVGGDHGNS